MLVLDRPVRNGFNELLELRLEFPFNLISQSWRVLKSWYTGGGPEQGFRRCFADGRHQKLSSVCGAGYLIIGAAAPGNFPRCSPKMRTTSLNAAPSLAFPTVSCGLTLLMPPLNLLPRTPSLTTAHMHDDLR